MSYIDPELYNFCTTDRQRKVLAAIEAHGGNCQDASRALGMADAGANNLLNYIRKRAAFQGYAPEAQLEHPVAQGFELKGYSHLTKTAAGENIWLKTRQAEHDYWTGLKDIIADVPPTPAAALPTPAEPQSDIVPWIQIGDAHIGMLASEHETGASFDIGIAEKEICAAITALIDEAPPCERLVINDLGDGTHYETFKAETEASGNRLDYDTRYWKMIRAYIRISRYAVEYALTKAQQVDCIYNQGNHSQSNDVWIAATIDALYGHTGRVNVLANESPYIAYRMGKTLVLVHHGHKAKPERVRDVMVHDFSEDWGKTEFRYIDGGHVHTSRRLELAGCVFESWNNLAPRDKYAHDAGWRSKQMMSLVLRSRKYGEVARKLMPIERVRDILRAKGRHYRPPTMKAFSA